MVRERDERIMQLQKNLVTLASMKDGGKGGGGSALSNGNNGELVSALRGGVKGEGQQAVKTVKILSKRQQAAKFLQQEFTAMQAESTERCQNLVNQLIELREMKRSSMGGGAGSGGGSVASLRGLSQGDLVHRCSALEGKVRRLEDELHEVEVQAGVRALVEAQELIDALQSELSATDRKNRVLTNELSKTGMGRIGVSLRGGEDKDLVPLSARSGASTPSLLPSVTNADEAWESHLEGTATRLEEARRSYENEMSGSGLLRKDADDGDDDVSDFDE